MLLVDINRRKTSDNSYSNIEEELLKTNNVDLALEVINNILDKNDIVCVNPEYIVHISRSVDKYKLLSKALVVENILTRDEESKCPIVYVKSITVYEGGNDNSLLNDYDVVVEFDYPNNVFDNCDIVINTKHSKIVLSLYCDKYANLKMYRGLKTTLYKYVVKDLLDNLKVTIVKKDGSKESVDVSDHKYNIKFEVVVEDDYRINVIGNLLDITFENGNVKFVNMDSSVYIPIVLTNKGYNDLLQRGAWQLVG